MSGKSKSERNGGFLGSLINQAIVPFSLLGMQQTYRKKGGKGARKGTRKVRKGRKSRRSQ